MVVDLSEDCDDTDPDVHPGAVDVPWDGVDQDCDGRFPGDLACVETVVGAALESAGIDRMPMGSFSESYAEHLGECWLGGYALDFSEMVLLSSGYSFTISEDEGGYEITFIFDLSLNEAVEPALIYSEVECIGGSCALWSEPFSLSVTAPVTIEAIAVDGEPWIDATVGEVETLPFSTETAPVFSFGECDPDALLDTLGFLGLDFSGVLHSLIFGAFEEILTELVPDIEARLEATDCAPTDEPVEDTG